MQAKIFPITLKDAYMLSPKVKHFVFKSTLNPTFDYLPGQFITIHFEKEGKILRRSYSIANVPQQNNIIEFAAGYVEGGPGTELLFNLKPGDTININGPFGRLILKEQPPKRYLLIATSTGITPYRAMITALKKQLQMNPQMRVVILQGVQKSEEILYGNEFIALVSEFPTQVDFRAHLSREPKENLKTFEYSGYVQTAFPELQLNPAEDLIYLCGNPSMIDQAFAYLKEKEFAMPQIIREKYISR